ncbi:MAG: serine/threonine protein kinase, partial [Planctomycetes bacterium]|nr:serine/threonine protein kinase [Planctomycetota bacterium]
MLHRTVAVKFLLAISTDKDSPQFDRFFGGARAEAAVKHPSIVSVYDAGQVNGIPYLILEYIDGPSLRAITRPSAPLPLSVAVAVLWDVAAAAQILHERNIVHSDLKPGNVLFDRDGHLLVTDFGLASLRKRTDSGGPAVGTPAYMAPEMFKGNASPQSDVYAMGIMLFELLAGRLPFIGDLTALREAHCESPLPVELLPDATPAPLIEMIERAAHKNEVFRYKRGELFQRALQDAVDMDELRRDGTTKLK